MFFTYIACEGCRRAVKGTEAGSEASVFFCMATTIITCDLTVLHLECVTLLYTDAGRYMPRTIN